MTIPPAPEFERQPLNPYDSPPSAAHAETPAVARPAPVFCTVMWIIDLVFCALRVLFVVLGIVGYFMLLEQGDDQMATLGIFEVLSGAGIVLFGIPANGLLLAKKRVGIPLGVLACISTLGSLGVGLVQGVMMLDQMPEGSPERLGGIIGGVFMMLVRLSLLGVYGAALFKFSAWLRETHSR